ncbi:MAG: hypothetical protein J7J52_01225 [Deltaproteobacteria bacterium]|nr:hypothetical protein [Deltaproteobacteria bacterium]
MKQGIVYKDENGNHAMYIGDDLEEIEKISKQDGFGKNDVVLAFKITMIYGDGNDFLGMYEGRKNEKMD